MLELSDQKIAEDLCKIGKSLAAKNMVHYLLGTISARISKNPPTFLVKPADCLYETAEPSDFSVVDETGKPQETDRGWPSLNFLAHVACYEARPDIDGVVHAHPENAVAFISQYHPSFNGLPIKEIPLLTQEAVWMVKNNTIPIVEDLEPYALALAVRKRIGEANVIAIRNHGIMAVGKNIWEAYGTALVVESEVKMLVRIHDMGGTPIVRNAATTEQDLCNMPKTFSSKFYRTL